MSIATLPCPTMTTPLVARLGARSVKSGWPLYQPTNEAEPITPDLSSPGTPSGRSRAAPTASTTASYRPRSSSSETLLPTSTLPKKRTCGDSAVRVYAFMTFLVCS